MHSSVLQRVRHTVLDGGASGRVEVGRAGFDGKRGGQNGGGGGGVGWWME